MDDIFSIIFFIWIAYAILEGVIQKKKIPPPLQLPSEQKSEDEASIDFQIPTLANDPNSPIVLAPPKSVVEIFQPEPPIQPQSQNQIQSRYERSKRLMEDEQNKPTINLNFTQADAMNAMILSEIFNKPKSLRKH